MTTRRQPDSLHRIGIAAVTYFKIGPTAVVEEPDGRRWADFEVGDRSENTFQQLYARLPEAELYRTDAYAVYRSWLPPGRHVVGKGGAVNWNEGYYNLDP